MKLFYKRAALVAFALVFGFFICNTKASASAYVTNILHEIVVPFGQEYIVVDVMDGIEARYRTGGSHTDIYGEYSCAAFVKNYYLAVYDVDVQNLTDTGPIEPAEEFRKVTTPQKGDIIFWPKPPMANNHSAIVKYFDGRQIILIEQNYKWVDANATYTTINRTVPWPPDSNNYYELWRLLAVPDEPDPEYDPGTPGIIPLPDYPTDQSSQNQTQHNESDPYTPQLIYESIVMIGRMAITVNGVDRPIDAPALIENDRTIMPVRYVSYAVGLNENDLEWNDAAKTATIYSEGNTIRFTIDSNVLYFNGEPVYMDVPAQIKAGGYAYLPIRYLADALGIVYEWIEFNEFSKGAIFYKYR